jgi:hypothetical protein
MLVRGGDDRLIGAVFASCEIHAGGWWLVRLGLRCKQALCGASTTLHLPGESGRQGLLISKAYAFVNHL